MRHIVLKLILLQDANESWASLTRDSRGYNRIGAQTTEQSFKGKQRAAAARLGQLDQWTSNDGVIDECPSLA